MAILEPGAGARIEAVDFGWHHAGRSNPSVSGINCVIESGQKVLLLGASGAGKSTFLHAMGGVIHDEDGESQLGTLTIDGLEPEAARGRVGLMQQDPESSVVLARVGDDVAFGPENLAVPTDQIWGRVADALAAVGLQELELDRSTSALSGGQKQRLGLAGILAMHPGALLLDEPTANLDPQGVLEVRDSVLAAQKLTGATLVVIEHRVGVWAEHMDRIIVIGADGAIAHDGAPEVVLVQARAELIAAGVWVPDYLPDLPERAESPGKSLLHARQLEVTRAFPSRKAIKERNRAVRAARPARLDLPVVASGINLTVRAGEHLSIIGPNGAGKSTVALTLAGLLYPVSGTLEAEDSLRAQSKDPGSVPLGADLVSWSSADLASRVGLVFQEPEQQFIRPTVRQELELGPRQVARSRKVAVDEPALNARIEELMRRLRLKHVENANPFTLSGGEKRRLSVATALATAPRVLVLDEPTFGQDAHTWHELVLLIRELLDQGIAVLSITHDLDFVRAVGGRALKVGGSNNGELCPVEELV